MAVFFGDVLQVIACSNEGAVWAIRLDNIIGTWQRVGQNIDFKTLAGAQVSYASAIPGRLDIFIVGTDEKFMVPGGRRRQAGKMITIGPW